LSLVFHHTVYSLAIHTHSPQPIPSGTQTDAINRILREQHMIGTYFVVVLLLPAHKQELDLATSYFKVQGVLDLSIFS
jgi:hypothetical protein